MDEKITISQSYTRKVNLGNYESEDFWASRSVLVPADTSKEKQDEIAEILWNLVVTEVERQKRKLEKYRADNDGVISAEKLKEMVEKVRNLQPLLLEEYLRLDPTQVGEINEAKKEAKRKQYKENKNGNNS